MEFILASASPRRAELLKKILKEFEIIPSQINEKTESEFPDEMVLENALAKANGIAEKNPDAIVFGADTVVVFDYKIIGKPRDLNQAKEMLASLSGDTHVAITAYAIVHKVKNEVMTETIFSTVKFNDLTQNQIDTYVDEFKPLDKAGSYGIQEIPEKFVDSLVGSYYNVMGLPIEELQDKLEYYLAGLSETM